MKAKFFMASAVASLALVLPAFARPHPATSNGNRSVVTSNNGNYRGNGNNRSGNFRGGNYSSGNYRGGYYRGGHWHRGWYGGNRISIGFGFGPGFFGCPYYGSYPYGNGYGYYPYGYGSGGYGYNGYGYGYNGYGYNSGPYGSSYSERIYGSRAYDNNSRNLVARVQAQLARQGYYRGAIDGVYGPRTSYAIRAYEGRHGLPVDGQIDRRLLSNLGVS